MYPSCVGTESPLYPHYIIKYRNSVGTVSPLSLHEIASALTHGGDNGSEIWLKLIDTGIL